MNFPACINFNLFRKFISPKKSEHEPERGKLTQKLRLWSGMVAMRGGKGRKGRWPDKGSKTLAGAIVEICHCLDDESKGREWIEVSRAWHLANSLIIQALHLRHFTPPSPILWACGSEMYGVRRRGFPAVRPWSIRKGSPLNLRNPMGSRLCRCRQPGAPPLS